MTTKVRRYSLPLPAPTSLERVTAGRDSEEERERKQPLVTHPTIDEQPEYEQDGEEGDGDEYWDELYMPTPPDGGWGWVIVFASFMCNVIVDGIAYSFGIFMTDFERYFQSSKGTTAWVGSLLSGCYLSVGPVVSALTNRYGCRPVTISGSIIASVAFLLSTVSPNIDVLMITYGIFGGIGFGLIYLPAIVSVGYYFEKKRALATGLAVCGSGVGTFVFAPMSKALLDIYDWRGATIILSGIILNCAVCGALMRPLKAKRIPIEQRTKPLLQRIAEEKKLQMERGSICGSSYFMVQLPDGSMERRPKYPLNMEPGVHSSFNLDQFGKIPETPVTGIPMPLPTIAENGHKGVEPENSSGSASASANASTSGSVVRMMIGSGPTVDSPPPAAPIYAPTRAFTPRPSLAIPYRVTGRVPNGIPKNYSVPILEGLARRNGSILRQDSFVKLSHSNVNVNGDLRKQSLRLKVSSGSLAGQGGAPVSGGRNNNYSVEQVWVKVGEGGLGSAVTVTEKQQKLEKKEYSRPMYRKDIFYSGSVVNLPQYSLSQRDLTIYRASVTSIPKSNILVLQTSEMDASGSPQVVIAKIEDKTMCPCLPAPMRYTFAEMLDFSLLVDPVFLLICISNVFGMLGFYVPFVYITNYAEKQGIPMDQSSFLLSVIGITNTIGRVVAGWISDRPNVNSLFVNNICLTLSGICVSVIPFCPTYISLILLCTCFGLFISAYISLTSIILVDLLGLDKLTNAFGLLILFRGGASIVGSPLAGTVYDSTGSYDASFFIAGGLILLSAVLSFMIPCVSRCTERRRQQRCSIVSEMDPEEPPPASPTQEGLHMGHIETTL